MLELTESLNVIFWAGMLAVFCFYTGLHRERRRWSEDRRAYTDRVLQLEAVLKLRSPVKDYDFDRRNNG